MMDPLHNRVQPTLEYLLLLALTVSVVLVGLNSGSLPRARDSADGFFQNVAADIMGPRPDFVNFSPVNGAVVE